MFDPRAILGDDDWLHPEMLRALRHIVAIVVPLLLLVLLLAVVLCFWNRWDETVIITLIPIWVWAGFAIVISAIVWPTFKSPLTAITFALWTATGVALADETSGLLRQIGGLFVKPVKPAPLSTGAPAPGDRIRVASLNLGEMKDPQFHWHAIAALQPDIVFFQQVPHDFDLTAASVSLCGEKSGFVRSGTCAVAGRGKLALLSDDLPTGGLIATLERPDGEMIDLMNVELSHQRTESPLWRPEAWVELTERRREGRRLMRTLIESMPNRIGVERQIVGGSFAAPPGDDIFRLLRNAGLADSYRRAGAGWGNTYPESFPVLRADQVWATAQFQPLRSKTAEFGSPRHLAVVTEFQRVTTPDTLRPKAPTPKP